MKVAISVYLTEASFRQRAVVCLAAGVAAFERRTRGMVDSALIVEVRLAQALVNRSQGRADLAVVAGMSGLDSNDAMSAELRNELALLHFAHGSIERGLAQLRAVCETDGEHVVAARLRAYALTLAVLAAQGNVIADDARQACWPRHWDDGPASLPVRVHRAWVFMSEKRFREASREIAVAIRCCDPVEFWTFLVEPLAHVTSAGVALSHLSDEIAKRDIAVDWANAPENWSASRGRLQAMGALRR